MRYSFARTWGVAHHLERVLDRRPRPRQRAETLSPFAERLAADDLTEDRDRLGGVLTDRLRIREARIVDQVRPVDVPAHVGPEATGLEHHERHVPAVGRPVHTGQRVTR